MTTMSRHALKLRQCSVDTFYPVGSYYLQFPDAASNTLSTAFPTSKEPTALFGGSWMEQFESDGAFFRTRGTAFQDTSRTNGLQSHDWKGVYWSSYNEGYQHNEYYMQKDMVTARGVVFNGNWATPANVVKIRWQPDNEAEIRPANRLMKIWIRTA